MASETLREFCAADQDLSAVLRQLEANIDMAGYVELWERIVRKPRSKQDKLAGIMRLTRHLLDRLEDNRTVVISTDDLDLICWPRLN